MLEDHLEMLNETLREMIREFKQLHMSCIACNMQLVTKMDQLNTNINDLREALVENIHKKE